MIPLDQYVALILEGQYDAAGVERPAMLPGDYRSVLRAAFDRHGRSAFDDPRELLADEGFAVTHAPLPRRCGVCLGDLIITSWIDEPRLRDLILQHERAHAWLERLGWRDATESDAWFQTAEFVLPRLYRWDASYVARHPHAPAWFLALIVDLKAA
jgi:hypothetical protein